MPHECQFPECETIPSPFLAGLSKWRANWLRITLISSDNPSTGKYFRSDVSIRKEKQRHLESGHTNIIHPYSKLREYYSKYLIVFYVLVMVTKPMHACIKGRSYTELPLVLIVTFSVVDVLTWIDIGATFMTGYRGKDGTVELRPARIAKNYLLGPFFWSDFLSSVPIHLFYGVDSRHYIIVILGIQKIFCFSRIIRLYSLIVLWTEYYWMNKSTTVVTTIFCLVTFVFTLHFCTCLLMSIIWIVRMNFLVDRSLMDKLQSGQLSFIVAYNECWFESSSYILGNVLPRRFYHIEYTEEVITIMTICIVGKLLIISTWIILVVNIMANKSTSIKFQKIMNQLESYMIQKHLPLDLRERLKQYYAFKYQGNYFKKDLLQYFLSNQLNRDIEIELCKSLINNVKILKALSLENIRELIRYLTPEIFLPGDIIIQSGTVGTSIYFISSGSVAIYTHSGKEICHLEDGSFFGEMQFLLKASRRMTTIMAIEITQTYRVEQTDFAKILARHKTLLNSIIKTAEARLRLVIRHEKLYKQTQFALTYANIQK